jgi:sugar phosphate isomerase/epimerase
MKLCISEVTTLQATFAEDVAAFAAAGWPAMEVWLTKLETHLQNHSAEATRQLIAENQIVLAAGAYQGGLLLSQGESRKEHFDHYQRRLGICQEFGIPTLLIVGDFNKSVDATSLQRAVVSLKQAAQWADGFGVRLALEFRGGDVFCSCLDTALTLVEQCGERNVGVNLDLFHWWKGPSKTEDLERLTTDNLFHVQIADIAGVPRELATDSDRIMPGDGDIRIASMLEHLQKMAYAGFVSLELMNPMLWQTKIAQVAELGLAAVQRLIPESSLYAGK